MNIDVTVLRVFTDADGNFGNALGVVDASVVDPSDRQQIAHELGYSETIFVDLPGAGATTAHAAIYTPRTQLPFAGHPSVGASWWLRRRGTPINTLQVPAGLVRVSYSEDLTAISAPAEWAPEFAIHDLDSPEAVLRADPTDFPTTSRTICGRGRIRPPGRSAAGCSRRIWVWPKTRLPARRRCASPNT